MIPNHSPWIHQLNRRRPVVPLSARTHADVAIVGGGIAGIVTAFFTLRNTDASVVLIEADKVAHGATGHNAGQLTSYFERPLFELAEEFGLELAIDGQQSVESAWSLIETIVHEAELQTPIHQFTGHAGISTREQLIDHFKNNRCRTKGGLQTETIVIADDWSERSHIPEEYSDLFATRPRHEILEQLETHNPNYIGALSYKKGCTNSALFSEELAGYLIATYPNRFSLFEGSPVKTVWLHEDAATLDVLGQTVEAGRVVLCTNGFENFTIQNDAGSDIDTKFHHSVAGRIGYMTGYVAPVQDAPTAVSYFQDDNTQDLVDESYFYLTRRPHERGDNEVSTLICVGGPEEVLPDGAPYSRDNSCSPEIHARIKKFLEKNYKQYPGASTEHEFCWHGLMGYTPNGIRRVGIEPCNPVLLYNLGCNGVGILPSIFGGKRISHILAGEQVPPSIFDPRDQRCDS